MISSSYTIPLLGSPGKIRLKREILDVDVEIRFKRRRYAGKRRLSTQRLRVVGVRDNQSGEYHFYITNISPDKLAAEDIQATYALRWEIELLFKETKQFYRLDDMPSRKRVVVETLLYAAILTLIASRRLLAAVRKKFAADQAHRLRLLRWATVLEAVSQELLAVVTRPYFAVRQTERDIASFLLYEALDPNTNRHSLLQSVESATHAYRQKNS